MFAIVTILVTIGAASRACASQLKFTITAGTTSCGNAGLTVPPSAPTSGVLDSDTDCSATITPLGLGGFYVGGGNGTILAGQKIPDGFTSVLDVLTSVANRCAAAKLKAAGSKSNCALKIESAESRHGVEEDESKLSACGLKMAQKFVKAELRPPCLTAGDLNMIDAKVDAFVNDVAASIAGVTDPPTASRCDAAKMNAAGSNARCRLKLASASARNGVTIDPGKLAFCTSKMSVIFAKAELDPPCSTSGDEGTIQGKIDAFVADVKGELEPNVAGSAGTGANDCLRGAGPGKHCVNDGSMPACTTDADCGGATGTCALDAHCFFGPPLPVVSPAPFNALSRCVLNVVATTASGSADPAAGSATFSLPLSSRVYMTGNSASPCPKCLSGTCDPTWKTNLAKPSPDSGMPCQPVGSQQTSNDCRPALLGLQAALPVTVSLTTGTASKIDAGGNFCTATAGQENPGAFGQPGARCIDEAGAPGGDLRDNAPHGIHLTSVFCIPSSGNAFLDGSTDLPGPGVFTLNGTAQLTP